MLGKLGITFGLFGSGIFMAQAVSATGDPYTSALLALLEYGVLGIAVVLLIVAYIRKDRQVNALYIRLIEKAERDSDKYHELAEAMNDVLQELTDAVAGD